MECPTAIACNDAINLVDRVYKLLDNSDYDGPFLMLFFREQSVDQGLQVYAHEKLVAYSE